MIDREVLIELGMRMDARAGTWLALGGGCIHEAWRVSMEDGRQVFVKTAAGARGGWLLAEARSLRLLAPHIRVPTVLDEGITGTGIRWLALEWLDMRQQEAGAMLGRGLAGLHRVRADRHGLDHDNFIGGTPQQNGWCGDWPTFFVRRRLQPQLELASDDGHPLPVDAILDAANRLLRDHHPAPSLLHGDLWSGNVASLADGTPVVFDPAAYFGDPETDLAMLELFGSPLGTDFFAAYGGEPAGRRRRKALYDLYHALNHLHLFGGGYLGMVRSRLDALGIRHG